MHYISCTDMGWSYTRVACAVFCSAVLRLSPRYNCAVFCITVLEEPELRMCFVLLCAVCVLFCCVPVHLEARATLVFEPSRNSLLCGLRHSPRLRCCTNVIWTLRWSIAIVCITAICFFYLQCVSYVSLILVADVYTYFAGTSNHSTVLSLTLECWC